MPCPLQQSLQAAYDERAAAHKAVVSEHSDNDIIRMNYDALLEYKQKLEKTLKAFRAAKKAYTDHIAKHGCCGSVQTVAPRDPKRGRRFPPLPSQA
jgi:heme oxygenase